MLFIGGNVAELGFCEAGLRIGNFRSGGDLATPKGQATVREGTEMVGRGFSYLAAVGDMLGGGVFGVIVWFEGGG